MSCRLTALMRAEEDEQALRQRYITGHEAVQHSENVVADLTTPGQAQGARGVVPLFRPLIA